MTKLIGWFVKATNDGKQEYVSGAFATEDGARVYKDLYLKSFPDSGAYVEHRVVEDRL